jgi:hypothetical protein
MLRSFYSVVLLSVFACSSTESDDRKTGSGGQQNQAGSGTAAGSGGNSTAGASSGGKPSFGGASGNSNSSGATNAGRNAAGGNTGRSNAAGSNGCECSSGPCCDGCKFRAASHVCEELAVRSSECSTILASETCNGKYVSIARVYHKKVCSGASAECTAWGDKVLDSLSNCTSEKKDSVCVTVNSMSAECGPCQ